MAIRTAVVTGAFSFTGRFIARELLARGWRVRTLTNSSYPGDPLAGEMEAFALDFGDPAGLERAMAGADLLVNTYWIRYPHAGMTFETAVANTGILLGAAAGAGVKGVLQVGVVGAAAGSPHPYIRWKWHADEELRRSGLAHAIVQPTLIFGDGDVLINNHAWLLRRMPVFLVAGDGRYEVQPVAGEDVARVAADLVEQDLLDGRTVDVGGPERLSYIELVCRIREAIGVRTPIRCAPAPVALAAATGLGWCLRDRIVTRDELAALRGGTLVSPAEPCGVRMLDGWLAARAATVGTHHARRQTRHRPRT